MSLKDSFKSLVVDDSGKLKGMVEKVKEKGQAGKEAVSGYVNGLKEQENINNELKAMSMEDRAKARGEGVKYCLVNSTGTILDVYDNKVVFHQTKSTSTMLVSLVFSTDDATRGDKTIYYKDAIGIQYKQSGIVDGYLQIETATGNMAAHSGGFDNENSFQFGKSLNEETQIVADFIAKKIDEIKSGSGNVIVQNTQSAADEIMKLKGLLDMGILSQEEFDAKKKQLLGI